MDLNKAMIIGRLTRDPEVKTIPSGQSVASFGIATNFTWTDQQGQRQEKVEFHNIVCWRKLAEICGQYLRKGKKVYIEGRLQTRQWEGQDGAKRSRTEIVADNMIMLDGGTGSPAGNVNRSSASPVADETPVIQVEENQSASSVSQSEDNKKNDQPSDKQSKDKISIEDIPF